MTAPLTQEQIDEGERSITEATRIRWELNTDRFRYLKTDEYPVLAGSDAWLRDNAPAIFATIKALQARVRELEGKSG